MLDYKLYYWNLPFRAIFIEMLLVEVGADYSRHDAAELYPQRSLNITNPGIAPPYLYECHSEKYFAQMPAILMHLGRRYDYLPKRPEPLTLCLKTVLDCNDVLAEITNGNGMVMWERKSWNQFRYDRLPRWMQVFEQTGLQHGLISGRGFLLGSRISVADIAATALFGTMTHAFPALDADLREHAPGIAALCQKIEARPRIRPLLAQQRTEHGRAYCGGQIERSIRAMIA